MNKIAFEHTTNDWPWGNFNSTYDTQANKKIPKISIVTPSYNQGEYIEKTIRSVLLQNYANLEYIIIDGGSTDNSVDIIKKYEDWIFFWKSQKDKGQTDAINQGLKMATGDIVAYINSDDYYLPETFLKVSEAFSQGKQWVAGAVFYTYDKVQKEAVRWAPNLDSSPSDFLVWLAKGGGLPQPGVFWSKSFVDQFGYFREDMHYCFDTEYWLRCLYNGKKLHYINANFAKRIIHPDCKTELNPEKFDAEFKNIQKEYLKKLPEKSQKDFTRVEKRVRSRKFLNEYRNEFDKKNYWKSGIKLKSAFFSSPVDFLRFLYRKIQKKSLTSEQ